MGCSLKKECFVKLLKNLLKSFGVLFLLSFGVKSYSALQLSDNMSVAEIEVEVPVIVPVDPIKRARLNKQASEREAEKAKLEKIKINLMQIFQNLSQNQSSINRLAFNSVAQEDETSYEESTWITLNEESDISEQEIMEQEIMEQQEAQDIYNEVVNEMDEWQIEITTSSQDIIDVCFYELIERREKLQNKMAEFKKNEIGEEIDFKNYLSEEFYRSAGDLLIEAALLDSAFDLNATSSSLTEAGCSQALDELLSEPIIIGHALSELFNIFETNTEESLFFYQFLKSIEEFHNEENYNEENYNEENYNDENYNEENYNDENDKYYISDYEAGYKDGYDAGLFIPIM